MIDKENQGDRVKERHPSFMQADAILKSHKSTWVVPDFNKKNPTIKQQPQQPKPPKQPEQPVVELKMSKTYSMKCVLQRWSDEEIKVIPDLVSKSSFHPKFFKIDFNLFKFQNF